PMVWPCAPVRVPKPHVASSEMLWPPLLMVPLRQFPPVGLLANRLLLIVRLKALSSLLMPPPKLALLPEKVLLVTIAVPLLPIPPPAPPFGALLPEEVLVVAVRVAP